MDGWIFYQNSFHFDEQNITKKFKFQCASVPMCQYPNSARSAGALYSCSQLKLLFSNHLSIFNTASAEQGCGGGLEPIPIDFRQKADNHRKHIIIIIIFCFSTKINHIFWDLNMHKNSPWKIWYCRKLSLCSATLFARYKKRSRHVWQRVTRIGRHV